VSQPENGHGPQPRSPAYDELLGILRDPHRHEVARNWEQVVQSELGPEDRRKAEAMAPVVKAYLSRSISRDEYDRGLAAATVPTVTDISATTESPPGPRAVYDRSGRQDSGSYPISRTS
jgi:hypothetical protein